MNYHKITVSINTTHKAAYFTGSMLRGAMGYALKKVTCINPSYNCEGCFASSSCLYHKFYESKNSFHKYRFEIELGSGKFDFGLYLFDDACEGLPYVLSALEKVLKESGVSKEKHTFSDMTMRVNGQVVYKDGAFSSLDLLPKTFQLDSFCPNIKVKLRTPLRIKRDNRFLRDDVSIEEILRSIYQREQEIFYGKKLFKLDYTPSYTSEMKLLKHQELVRKSGRQKQRMKMDGIVGEMVIMGIDERSYELLKLGEIIGCGKQTVMGLGGIEVLGLK